MEFVQPSFKKSRLINRKIEKLKSLRVRKKECRKIIGVQCTYIGKGQKWNYKVKVVKFVLLGGPTQHYLPNSYCKVSVVIIILFTSKDWYKLLWMHQFPQIWILLVFLISWCGPLMMLLFYWLDVILWPAQCFFGIVTWPSNQKQN